MSVNPFTMPLDLVVNVAVYTAPQAEPRRTFNQLLVIGSSMSGQTPVIPSSERVRQYALASAMLTDGFTIDSPEYKAALLYFSQDVQGPAPTILWVGCKDPSAIETWNLDSGNVGEGYSIGNILTVTQSGASGGQFQVASVGVGAITAMVLDAPGSGYHANDILTIAGGTGATYEVLSVDGSGVILTGQLHTAGTGYTAVTGAATTAAPSGGTNATITTTVPHISGEVETVIQIAKGTGYSPATDLPTTVAPSGGTGCQIDILTVGELAVEALTACRNANWNWYVGFICGAAKADHLSCAAYIEAAQPSSVYAYVTQDADVPTSASTDVMSMLKGYGYSRTIGQYDPVANNSIVGVMGYAMGQNNGLADSFATIMFKQEIGIATANLSLTQVGNVMGLPGQGTGKNGNLYLNYDNFYNWFAQGVMANGMWWDLRLNLDMLANAIQLNLADLANSRPAIPQTDQGTTQRIHAVNMACQDAVNTGFLAPGVYNGPDVLTLLSGSTLPSGYAVVAPLYATQSTPDRQARKGVPIYIAVTPAGAVQSMSIGIYVSP